MSKKAEKIYFTITGMKYFHGQSFLKPGMIVTLKKEPDNEYDSEAILVSMEGLGNIGHVANSPYTVKGESYSAGRLYDHFKKKATGQVMYVLDSGAVCVFMEKAENEHIIGGQKIRTTNEEIVYEKLPATGGYVEPSDYFPKEIRKKFGLGEYADKSHGSKN